MKKLPSVLIVIVAATFALTLLSCSKTDSNKTANEADKLIVAKFDDQKINAAVLEKYLESRSLQITAEDFNDQLKKKVDELVVEELMYREALRLKLDQLPDTRQRIKEIVNAKYTAEQIQQPVTQRKIEQTELQAYYNSHQEEFSRPEEVRIADVFIAMPKDASDARRAELKQKAETVLSEALTSPNQRMTFSQLIQKYSDQPEKYAKGDTGFFSAEGKPAGIDPELVEAAFKLEKTGDISTAVIEAGDGYHIIMQMGKRAAFNKPFEQVARHLERRIKNDEIQKKRDEIVQGLKAKAKIEIDEKALTQVQEKLKTANKMKPISPQSQNFQPAPSGINQAPRIIGTENQQPAIPDANRPQPPMPGNHTDNASPKGGTPAGERGK